MVSPAMTPVAASAVHKVLRTWHLSSFGLRSDPIPRAGSREGGSSPLSVARSPATDRCPRRTRTDRGRRPPTNHARRVSQLLERRSVHFATREPYSMERPRIARACVRNRSRLPVERHRQHQGSGAGRVPRRPAITQEQERPGPSPLPLAVCGRASLAGRRPWRAWCRSPRLNVGAPENCAIQQGGGASAQSFLSTGGGRGPRTDLSGRPRNAREVAHVLGGSTNDDRPIAALRGGPHGPP